MEPQIRIPPAGSVALWGGGTQKSNNGLCPPLVGRKLFPSSCLDVRHFSSPYIPLVPFKLLPECCSSEEVSLSKSVYRFFKRNCWDPRSFFHWFNSTGFCSQNLWGFVFLALGPCAGGPCVWIELLTLEISLPNVYLPYVDVEPAHPTSPPLLLVWMDLFSLIL